MKVVTHYIMNKPILQIYLPILSRAISRPVLPHSYLPNDDNPGELRAKTPPEVAKNTLSSGPIGHICYIQKHPKGRQRKRETLTPEIHRENVTWNSSSFAFHAGFRIRIVDGFANMKQSVQGNWISSIWSIFPQNEWTNARVETTSYTKKVIWYKL